MKNKKAKKEKNASGDAEGQSSNLLSQFWSLASFDEKERVSSVFNILKEIESSETQVKMKVFSQQTKYY